MEPLILVTNDDGILSPGLIAAAEAVQGLGDLLIAAPRTQQTAMGRAFPRAENVGLIEEFELLVNHRRVTGYGLTGPGGFACAARTCPAQTGAVHQRCKLW